MFIFFSGEIKMLLSDPVFSYRVNFINKVPFLNCSRNSKSSKGNLVLKFEI